VNDRPLRCPYCGGSLPPTETVCTDCHEDLAALVRLRCEDAIYYNEALFLAREGDLEAARARLILSLERNPRFLPAQRLLAKVCAALGDWTGARRAAARALDLAPDDDLVRRLAAEVEAAAERHAQAVGRAKSAAAGPAVQDSEAAARTSGSQQAPRRTGLFGRRSRRP